MLKIMFVWLLSVAMSLPLSLMYSQVRLVDRPPSPAVPSVLTRSLSVTELRLRARRRFLSDSRSAVQVDRVHRLLLRAAVRDDGHVRSDGEAPRSPAAELGSGTRLDRDVAQQRSGSSDG